MTSHLLRLFRYAKATASTALENFATEALAEAVRTEVAPLLAALETVGVGGLRGPFDVQTQVPVDGVGVLDLVVSPTVGRPIVFEVKIHAGESGGQLQRYLEWIAAQPPDRRPRLVTLCRARLSNNTDVVWLSWQALRRLAIRSTERRWQDFTRFLRENEMADDSDEPVTPVEAKVILEAHELLRKAAVILTGPAQHANRRCSALNWPDQESKIRKVIAKRFGHFPSYTIASTPRFRAGLTMGIYHEPETSDAWLGIWVWAKPNYLQERARIAERTTTLIGAPWYPEQGTWNPFGAYARLADFGDHERAAAWLVERIDDLARVGLLDLFPELGSKVEEDEGDQDEDE